MKTTRISPRLFAALFTTASLLATGWLLHPAFADEEEGGEEGGGEANVANAEGAQRSALKGKKIALSPVELAKKRKAIFAAVTTDESVLINASSAEMPASPDLINLGKKATKALARCVADNVDDGIRAYCAGLLGRLGDTSALPALQGALEAWDPGVRAAALEALRMMPSPTSDDALIKITLREDEVQGNVSMAYAALAGSATPKAIAALRAAFHAKPNTGGEEVKDGEVKYGHAEVAFAGLWRARHRVARATLISEVTIALRSAGGLQSQATKAAAELRASELVPALIPLMNHPDQHIRNSAVYALGKIGDRAATSALVAQIPKVREARMLNNIAFALERLDTPAFFSVTAKLADHRQAAIRMNTAFVLGDVRRAEGIPLLAKALRDKNDMVRISAVHALGQIDSKEVEPLLTPFVGDANTALSHEAIYGIYESSGKKNTTLLYSKLYASEDPVTKSQAMFALMANGDPRVSGDALACIETGACPFPLAEAYLMQSKAPEVPGRMMLEWTQGNRNFMHLVATLKPQGAAPLAASWISKGLARNNTQMLASATELAGLLHDRSALIEVQRVSTHDRTLLRIRGLVALAGLGEAGVEAKIAAELDNLSESQLFRAAHILAVLDTADARARLLPLLTARMKSPSPRLALAVASVHFAWDPDAGVFRLLEGLASENTLERAIAYNYLRADSRERVTWLLRRAAARESRPLVADALRTLVDARP